MVTRSLSLAGDEQVTQWLQRANWQQSSASAKQARDLNCERRWCGHSNNTF